MFVLICLACLPLMYGIFQLIQCCFKKTASEKKYCKVHGTVKSVVGLLTGVFLSYVYVSYEFFTQKFGSMLALIICWIILTICNVAAQTKIGIDEYDKKQLEDNEEPCD